MRDNPFSLIKLLRRWLRGSRCVKIGKCLVNVGKDRRLERIDTLKAHLVAQSMTKADCDLLSVKIAVKAENMRLAVDKRAFALKSGTEPDVGNTVIALAIDHAARGVDTVLRDQLFWREELIGSRKPQRACQIFSVDDGRGKGVRAAEHSSGSHAIAIE